jgi:hypothetical protein
MVAVTTSATVISYSLYLVAGPHEGLQGPGDLRLLSTLPFVIYGVFRYLYLVYKRGEGGEPESLVLRDRPFLVNIAAWLALMVWLLPR